MEGITAVINRFSGREHLPGYLTIIVGILITIVVSWIVIRIGSKFIDRLMRENRESRYMEDKRVKTLKILLKSVLRYTIYFFAAMIILTLLNVPVGSLIAGAGVIGVAVGFGAQNLVKDVITGFFILFENQFSVGDYIETSDASGTVEEIGLRITKVRNFGGQLHIIPNSEITKVTNFSKGAMRVLVDVGVGYDENIDSVLEILSRLCSKVAEEKEDIITEGPRVLGVQELAASGVVIRLWAKTVSMEQWALSRYLRRRIKETLDNAGVEIPYPHRVILKKDSQEVAGDD